MLQGINAAPGFLDLRRHQLAGFLNLSQSQHIRQEVLQGFDRIVQITGGKSKTVRVDVMLIGCLGFILKFRYLHTHDILRGSLQIDLLSGCQQGYINHLIRHGGSGQQKVLIRSHDSRFHLLTKSLILSHQV
jgi:hypothetical protein